MSDVPIELAFKMFIKERVDEEWIAHMQNGAELVESLRGSWFEERRSGAEAELYRIVFLGGVGWIVTGLYRLDVRMRSLKDQGLEFELEEEGNGSVERIEDASQLKSNSSGNLITAGIPIIIPTPRQSLRRHSRQASESLPIYFTTSLSSVVALLIFVPFSMRFVEGHAFTDGVRSSLLSFYE